MERLRNVGGKPEQKAMWAMVETVPTTLAGAAALASTYTEHDMHEKYLTSFSRENDETGCEESALEVLLQSLATALRNLGGVS